MGPSNESTEHAITRSLTPHPPGAYIKTPKKTWSGKEIVQAARILMPIEVVWLMGVGGLMLSIMAMLTPWNAYIKLWHPHPALPVSPSYYHLHPSHPSHPPTTRSVRRKGSSASIGSTSSSILSTESSESIETPSATPLYSILIDPLHPHPSARKVLPNSKRVSFKEDVHQKTLDGPLSGPFTLPLDERTGHEGPVLDVWAQAVIDDLMVLRETAEAEALRKRGFLKRPKALRRMTSPCYRPKAAAAGPAPTSPTSPSLSPTPSFSSTMSDPACSTHTSLPPLGSIPENPSERGRPPTRRRFFRKETI